MVRFSMDALARPRELHAPEAAALANAEQPCRAAVLALMCSEAPPVAARLRSRGHAGNPPDQNSRRDEL
jgi:hypothetical protein